MVCFLFGTPCHLIFDAHTAQARAATHTQKNDTRMHTLGHTQRDALYRQERKKMRLTAATKLATLAFRRKTQKHTYL